MEQNPDVLAFHARFPKAFAFARDVLYHRQTHFLGNTLESNIPTFKNMPKSHQISAVQDENGPCSRSCALQVRTTGALTSGFALTFPHQMKREAFQPFTIHNHFTIYIPISFHSQNPILIPSTPCTIQVSNSQIGPSWKVASGPNKVPYSTGGLLLNKFGLPFKGRLQSRTLQPSRLARLLLPVRCDDMLGEEKEKQRIQRYIITLFLQSQSQSSKCDWKLSI